MSDKRRWSYGDTNPVYAAVDSATVIEIGDLIYQDRDNGKPASLQSVQGIQTTAQAMFAERFLGVAMERSRIGNTDAIRVATSSVFEFDCVGNANVWELGDLVGPEQNYSGSANGGRLLNQHVVAVAASHLAIARIAKGAPIEVTSVLVKICSTIMNGGVAGTTAAGRG